MELKSIKLVGFKSFVDPTTIEIKGNMNSIVGPNGCGKSNVVDAVRWVVGESSAKQLRGQSMSDVIFNGTTSRKPVGKAAVELLFDNIISGLSYLLPILIALPLLPSNIRSDTVDSRYDMELIFILL